MNKTGISEQVIKEITSLAEKYAITVEEHTATLLTYDVIDMNKNHQVGILESIKKEGKILYEKI